MHLADLCGLRGDLPVHPVGVLVDAGLPGRQLRFALVEVVLLREDPLLGLRQPGLALRELLLALAELLRPAAALLVALVEGAVALLLARADVALTLGELLLLPRGLLLALLERRGAVLGLRDGLAGLVLRIGHRLASAVLGVGQRLGRPPLRVAQPALALFELLFALARVLVDTVLCVGEALLEPGELLLAARGRGLLLGELGLELLHAPALFLERFPLGGERTLALGDVGLDLREARTMVVELGGGPSGLVVLAELALVGLDLLGERLLQVELARERGRQLGP